jgi:hypothetical protein
MGSGEGFGTPRANTRAQGRAKLAGHYGGATDRRARALVSANLP